MINRIYASKFYKNNPRKDKIKAALQNPNNLQLVQQISDYLDEDYKQYTEEGQKAEEEKLEEVQTVEPEVTEEPTSKSPSDENNAPKSINKPSHTSKPSAEPIKEIKPNKSEKPEDKDEAADKEPAPAPEKSEEKKVEESTIVEGESVTASCYTPSKAEQVIANIPDMVDEIAGLLNNHEDTKGVARIMIKEDNKEMWIHYEDSVNLNNVMSNVIMLLNASGYVHLIFNRLARTDNAVVFEIQPNVSVVVEQNEEEKSA